MNEWVRKKVYETSEGSLPSTYLLTTYCKEPRKQSPVCFWSSELEGHELTRGLAGDHQPDLTRTRPTTNSTCLLSSFFYGRTKGDQWIDWFITEFFFRNWNASEIGRACKWMRRVLYLYLHSAAPTNRIWPLYLSAEPDIILDMHWRWRTTYYLVHTGFYSRQNPPTRQFSFTRFAAALIQSNTVRSIANMFCVRCLPLPTGDAYVFPRHVWRMFQLPACARQRQQILFLYYSSIFVEH